jgi:hypothetical protein
MPSKATAPWASTADWNSDWNCTNVMHGNLHRSDTDGFKVSNTRRFVYKTCLLHNAEIETIRVFLAPNVYPIQIKGHDELKS